jgi:hypothetical protein
MAVYSLFIAVLLTNKSVQVKTSFITHYQFLYEDAI